MLQVNDLTVAYEGSGAHAVHHVTFDAEAGERIAVMGPNGAGKSTLLLALVGVLPASGTVCADGITLTQKNLRLLRRRVGLLFQNPDDQLFMQTVHEDVAFGPRNAGLTEAEAEARADEALSALGISYIKKRATHKLSGGEKRLVALAGLLAMEPAVLLMDEPSVFLDPRAERRLVGLLNGLPQTLIMATHDVQLARSVCERVILMKDGAVFADGAMETILANVDLLEACGL